MRRLTNMSLLLFGMLFAAISYDRAQTISYKGCMSLSPSSEGGLRHAGNAFS